MSAYDTVEEYLLSYCGDMNKFRERLKNLSVIAYFFLLLIRICLDCSSICLRLAPEGAAY